MDDLRSLFTELLELEAPFELIEINKDTTQGKVQSITFVIGIDAVYRPSKHHTLHSSYEKTWQHLSLFQYPCFIQARLPVFKDKRNGKTQVIEVPWARKGSGFTLLFEEQVLELLRYCNCISNTARFFNIYPQRVKTIYDAYTKDAYEQREAQVAPKVGVDETSTKKGHSYISLFVDLDTGQILDIQDGRSSDVIKAYADELQCLGKPIEQIEEFSLDMSPAFISGVEQYFSHTRMTYDHFHVMQLIHRYVKPLWRSKQVDHQKLEAHLQDLGRLWVQPNWEQAAAFLSYWLDRSKELFQLDRLCKSIHKHFERIANYVESLK